MRTPVHDEALAAPAPVLFIVANTALAALLSALVASMLLGAKENRVSPLPVLLVPAIVATGAWWVGRAKGLTSLLLRSMATHAVASVPPLVAIAWDVVSGNRPGATGHGGVFLVAIIYFFYVMLPASVLGLVGALVARGAMALAKRRSRT